LAGNKQSWKKNTKIISYRYLFRIYSDDLEDGKNANGFQENLEIVERPERAPSVYENVAVAEKNEEEKSRKLDGEGERRGEKGEIWYELGCV
jgi:hypothetical protein